MLYKRFVFTGKFKVLTAIALISCVALRKVQCVISVVHAVLRRYPVPSAYEVLLPPCHGEDGAHSGTCPAGCTAPGPSPPSPPAVFGAASPAPPSPADSSEGLPGCPSWQCQKAVHRVILIH